MVSAPPLAAALLTLAAALAPSVVAAKARPPADIDAGTVRRPDADRAKVGPAVPAETPARAAAPAPYVTPEVADQETAGDANAFFRAGQMYLGGASSLALERVDGSGVTPGLRFAVDVDVGRFLSDRWALGGALDLVVRGQNAQTSLELGVGPTVAASFSLNPSLAFWPRLGVLFVAAQASARGLTATSTGVSFDLLLPVVFQLNGGLGLRIGPHLAATVLGAATTATSVTYGLRVGLVGWR